MEGSGRQGRADPAFALGQHQHEKSKVSRRHVCGRVDRAEYRRHHSAGDFRCFPRSWPRPPELDGKRRRSCKSHGFAREGRHLHEGSHREAGRRWRETFCRCVQAIVGGDRQDRWRPRVSLNTQLYMLPEKLEALVKTALDDWKKNDKVRRLWQRDASVWTGTDEAQWLGWLDIVEKQLAQVDAFKKIAADVKKAKFKHVLLLGMGGSSLCPEVLRMTFGKIKGFPELHVLDSTDPAQIKAIEAKVDLKSTICIVSSKSGSTLEPNIYKQYFFERVKAKVGEKEAGNRFIAITDPGSKMQQVAEADKFRKIFMGVPSIGGRYSALSNFGMVPAAVMGLDVAKFLKNTEEMVKACGAASAADLNPGVVLGNILGVAANHGRDKITIITSPEISDLGAWLEQLIAESTGKIGKGIIPVDRERLAKPATYGNDRVFAYLRLASKPNKAQDAAVAVLEKAGHAVVRITLPNIYNLGQEFFRWEIATAVAGSIIGINAFNQPDVEASKIETRKLTTQYEATGSLPPEVPFFETGGIKLFADEKNVAAAHGPSLVAVLKAHLSRLSAGDYFAVLGYI